MPGCAQGGVCITSDGDVLTLPIPSTTRDNIIHTLISNKRTKKIHCTCEHFQYNNFCKHTKMYREVTHLFLYGTKYRADVITSFKNCAELVSQICDVYPECIGNYKLLVKRVWDVKEYSPETIDRSYRKLVEFGEIKEPTDISIRKAETEKVMHQINQWDTINRSHTDYNQTVLLEES